MENNITSTTQNNTENLKSMNSEQPNTQQPQPNPFGQQQPQPNPLGQQQPQSNPFGQQQPQSNSFGQQQPQSNPFGQQQPQSNPFGQQQPQSNPFGQQQPQPSPFGQQQPQPNPFVQQQPQSNPFGQQQPQPVMVEPDVYGLRTYKSQIKVYLTMMLFLNIGAVIFYFNSFVSALGGEILGLSLSVFSASVSIIAVVLSFGFIVAYVLSIFLNIRMIALVNKIKTKSIPNFKNAGNRFIMLGTGTAAASLFYHAFWLIVSVEEYIIYFILFLGVIIATFVLSYLTLKVYDSIYKVYVEQGEKLIQKQSVQPQQQFTQPQQQFGQPQQQFGQPQQQSVQPQQQFGQPQQQFGQPQQQFTQPQQQDLRVAKESKTETPFFDEFMNK